MVGGVIISQHLAVYVQSTPCTLATSYIRSYSGDKYTPGVTMARDHLKFESHWSTPVNKTVGGKCHKFLACVETTAPKGNTFWRIFYDDDGGGGRGGATHIKMVRQNRGAAGAEASAEGTRMKAP